MIYHLFLRCATSRTSAPVWTCCSRCESCPSVWRTLLRSDSHYKHLICTCQSCLCRPVSVSLAFRLSFSLSSAELLTDRAHSEQAANIECIYFRKGGSFWMHSLLLLSYNKQRVCVGG